jgi:ribonuclease-3
LPDLTVLKKILDVPFDNNRLLERALTHSSFVNENPSLAPESNERMEFLGDAVLDLIIAGELYHKIPEAAEGELTKIRAELVSGETLARLARSICLGDYLYLGKGEEINGGRDKIKNLAGALEALIAAVFLNHGYAAANRCVLHIFHTKIIKAINIGIESNTKSRLQEIMQAKGDEKPTYCVTMTEGPEHNRYFTVEVRSGGTILSKGKGKSKKLAEIEAARLALEKILR